MTTATIVLFWVAVVAAVSFPILYTALAPWWRSQTGRHVFSLATVIALVLLIQVARVIFHDFTGREVIDLLTYIATAAVLLNQVRLLLIAQIRHHREDARR